MTGSFDRCSDFAIESASIWKPILGSTKVFVKDEHDVELENHREKSLLKYILVLPRAVRGWYAKRTFQRLKRSVTNILVSFHFKRK